MIIKEHRAHTRNCADGPVSIPTAIVSAIVTAVWELGIPPVSKYGLMLHFWNRYLYRKNLMVCATRYAHSTLSKILLCAICARNKVKPMQ